MLLRTKEGQMIRRPAKPTSRDHTHQCRETHLQGALNGHIHLNASQIESLELDVVDKQRFSPGCSVDILQQLLPKRIFGRPEDDSSPNG